MPRWLLYHAQVLLPAGRAALYGLSEAGERIWWHLREMWGFYAIGTAVVVLFYFAIVAEIEWQKWAAEHCTVIGHVAPSSGTGIDANGNVTVVTIPGKTGYRCDDGMEYWR